MTFIGLVESNEKTPDFSMGKAVESSASDTESSNNIIELNKLEKELAEKKKQIRKLKEPDETLSVLVNQLESELGKLKKGKADQEALDKGKELLSMINDRLEEKGSPIKELQRKVKKPAQKQESKERKGVEKMKKDKIKKEEEKIREAMQSKLDEQKQKQREEEVFEEVEEDLFEEELPTKTPRNQSEEVEEGYFEPGEKKEKETPKKEKKPQKKKPPKKPKPSGKTEMDIDKAEALYKASVNQILKAQLDNGAIVSSTAEKSYLHIFPRNHGFCTLALIKAEKFDNAKKAIEFALKHQNSKNGSFPQRWDEAGNSTGYKPVESDATAMVLFAFAKYVLEKNNVDFAEKNWDKIEKAVDFLVGRISSEKNLVSSPASVHQFPSIEKGYEIWTNALCCAAFRELSKVAEKIKVDYEPLFQENKLKDSLLEYMWNSRLKGFVKSIKIREANSVVLETDASALALSFFDVFPPKDKRLNQTIESVDKKLWFKPFGGISRFERVEGREIGGFGASPFFTLLLADYYTDTEQREKAEKYLSWTINTSFDGLLPEHISTKEDFEGFVSDFSDAGLLNRKIMKLINKTRSHPEFEKGIAHIQEPQSIAHAAFIIAWNNYKQKFLE